jgi:hypothetical protein
MMLIVCTGSLAQLDILLAALARFWKVMVV